jgi:hypothetical protein
MRQVLIITFISLAVACSKGEQSATSTSSTAAASGEKTYAMTGTVIGRDPARNILTIDNVEVPGNMMAMKMAYEVRGAQVATLPADGRPVEVTVHDRNGAYYLTDVKPKK